MKRTISFLLMITIFISATGFKINHAQKENIEIIFTHDLKFADLAKIKQTLLEKGICIEYRKLEFDKLKNLKKMEFFVDCKDGYSGTANATRFAIEKKFGFYRNYDENSKNKFFAGFF